MRRHSKHPLQHGFTLFELLVAIAVFSLLSVISFGGLKSILDSKETVDQELERLTQVQRTFFVLSTDLEQMVDRPVRDDLGTEYPALSGGQNVDATLISFTRTGWQNPAYLPRSYLQRVAYALEDDVLVRLYWQHLDHLQVNEPVRRHLLDGVEQVSFEYISDEEAGDVWPSLDQGYNERGEPLAAGLPRAIQVTVVLKDWGEITRLFKVPGV
jgi:general secretion pathway protein J